MLTNKKEICNLTDDDMVMLKDFIFSGYSVKEQTNIEYTIFLDEARIENEKTGCTSYYNAVYHKGKWTSYIRTLKSIDESGSACPIPTCASAGFTLIWNDLVPVVKDEGCNFYFWFDNQNKDCGRKQFCGMYMYFGLQTFQTLAQCEKALKYENYCSEWKTAEFCQKDYNPVCGCYVTKCEVPPCPEECKVYNNSCLACSKNIDYWIDGECKNKKSCPEQTIEENGKCYATLSNGRKAEIKIMPETASARAIERLGELNFTIELKEFGKGDNAKAIYKLTGNKEGKFLGIFKIIAKVQVQVDAETGDVKVIKPWWNFLATGI